MRDKDAIQKIQSLKRIKASNDWTDLSLEKLEAKISEKTAGEDFGFSANFFLRPAFSACFSVVVAVAGIGLMVEASGSSLPGDWLYPVKTANEKIQRSSYGIVSNNMRFEKDLDISARRVKEFDLLLNKIDAGNNAVAQARLNSLAKDFSQSVEAAGGYLDEIKVKGNDTGKSLKVAVKLSENIGKFEKALNNAGSSLPEDVKKEIGSELAKAVESAQKVRENALAVIKSANSEETMLEIKARVGEKLDKLSALCATSTREDFIGEEAVKEINNAKKMLEEGNLIEALEKAVILEQLLIK